MNSRKMCRPAFIQLQKRDTIGRVVATASDTYFSVYFACFFHWQLPTSHDIFNAAVVALRTYTLLTIPCLLLLIHNTYERLCVCMLGKRRAHMNQFELSRLRRCFLRIFRKRCCFSASRLGGWILVDFPTNLSK